MDEELSDGSIFRTSGEFINALISILDWLKFALIDHSSLSSYKEAGFYLGQVQCRLV